MFGSVAHQPAGCDKITDRISRRNPVARRQGGKLHAAAGEECVGGDEEGIGALARKGGKGRIDLAARAGVEDMDLQPDDAGGFLHVPQRGLGARALAGLRSTATRTALGTSSCRSPSRLATTSSEKKLMPVALPPGRARLATRPSLTGSSADAEDDRDRRGRSFGRERSRRAAGRGDDGHTTADQVSHQRRQAIVLALQPVVLDRHVLALDVAGFAKAFAERGHIVRAEASADPALTNPITGIAGCCARAASGHAAAPPSPAMNSRRFIRSPRRRWPTAFPGW